MSSRLLTPAAGLLTALVACASTAPPGAGIPEQQKREEIAAFANLFIRQLKDQLRSRGYRGFPYTHRNADVPGSGVEVEITIQPSGLILRSRCLRSSGEPHVDDVVIKSLAAIGHTPPPPRWAVMKDGNFRMVFGLILRPLEQAGRPG
jgi:TonB family protein